MTLSVAADTVRYRITPYVTAGTLGSRVVALTGEAATVLDGEGVAAFVERLHALVSVDQGASIDELTRLLDAHHDVENLVALMEQLVAAGLLIAVTGDVSPYALLASQQSGQKVSIEEAQRNIDETIVEISGVTESPLAVEIQNVLQSVGITVTGQTERTDNIIRVVVGTAHVDPVFVEANTRALMDGVPWLAVSPFDGRNAWVGPFMVPNQSACFTCFRLRRSANFSDEVMRAELTEIQMFESAGRPIYSHPLVTLQAGLVANLVGEWVALRDYGPSAIPGGISVISLDDRGVGLEPHRTLRVPRCPDCSPVATTGLPQVWFHPEEA